jgi:hypothetical protein
LTARVFKTRHFARWMRKTALTDPALCCAVREMAAGLVDADLGGGVVKKRIGLPGRGKKGSVRTIVATRRAGLSFFVHGFAKSERENITSDELAQLRGLSGELLTLSPGALDVALIDGALEEICDGCEAH